MAKLIVEIDLSDEEERYVAPWAIEHCFRYLMADALSEFYRSRGYKLEYHEDNADGVAEYVERRYDGMDESFRARKRSDVMLRCRVARAMHEGFLSPTRLEVVSGPVSDEDHDHNAPDRTDPGVPQNGPEPFTDEEYTAVARSCREGDGPTFVSDDEVMRLLATVDAMRRRLETES